MKLLLPFTLILSLALGIAQPPSGYYNSTQDLEGFELKTELKEIITNGSVVRSYGSLIGLYETSDNDDHYDTGQSFTILDIYSENPDGADPYTYAFNDNGSSFRQEGDGYNREHLYPQGFFNSDDNEDTMRNDAHHVVPTDGVVNNRRGSFPFGEVGTADFTSENGSQRGSSITPGFTGTVFEPIDEFKGDVARSLFYFATRYEDQWDDPSWEDKDANELDPRGGDNKNVWFESWFVDLLLDWHNQDPVSDREIERNNEIFDFQNNRNPFIDNPQFVNTIWGDAADNFALAGTLSGSYVDTNGNNVVDDGDEIQYTYEISNVGTETLFDVDAAPDKGIFDDPRTLQNLTAGTSSQTPFGILRYLITQEDINSACQCVSNQLSFQANTSDTNDGAIIRAISDDPNNDNDQDRDNDGFPDDITVTELPITGTGTTASDLFISEYIEGTGNNKAIEIANFTGNPIDLSNYSLQRDTNGNGSWQNETPLSGTLENEEVFVIARSAADAAITDEADVTVGSGTALDFNGNDPVGLFKDNILIDIVGFFASGATPFSENETLVRKPEVVGPNTMFNREAEWNAFPVDDSSDLGRHTYGNTASVNDDVLSNIRLFPNPSSGIFNVEGDLSKTTIKIYDLAGRLLQDQSLQNNQFVIEKTGLYLVRLNNGNAVKVFKVSVQ